MAIAPGVVDTAEQPIHLFVLKEGSFIGDHRFPEKPLTLGSDEDCTIPIPDTRVANRHVRLAPAGLGQWTLEVLDFEYPTQLNGMTLSDNQPLRNLDEIEIGPYVIRVYLESGPPPRRIPPPPAAAVSPVDTAGPPMAAADAATERRQPAVAPTGPLHFARQIQDALTLRVTPNWPDVQIAVHRRRGDHRCCDLYDVVRLADRTVSILTARIEGDPVTVARLMSQVHATYRAQAPHADPPHALARTLNWLLGGTAEGWRAHLACAWIAPDTGAIRYCLAGDQITMAIIKRTGEATDVACQASAIGEVAGFAYHSVADTLEPGDILSMMTHGLELLRDASGEPFGRRRATETLCDLAGRDATEMIDDLSEELDSFAAGGACREDATIMLACRPL